MHKRIGVVGFGSIGRHHARNLSTLAEVDFAGVAEPNEAARAEAAALGFATFSSLEALLASHVDGVILSVPTSLHFELGLMCIEARCGLLIEKPIAHRSDLGEVLIRKAAENSVPIMIGYVERYNPAILAVRKFMADGNLGRIFSIDARRVGVMPARISDANVLVDIGVHDIDLVAFITGADLELKSALGGRAVLNDRVDYASLALDAGGISVHITSNWITPVKIRDLFVTGENGSCHVDYVTQTARFAAGREFTPKASYEGEIEQYSAGKFTDLPIEKEEPLRRELRAFIDGLRGDALPDPYLSLTSLRIAEEATLMIESKAPAKTASHG